MAYLKEENNVKVEELILTPHFVIKTKTFSPYQIFPPGTKFFINVCTNSKVPTKELIKENGEILEGFDAQAIFISISKGEWEIPILTSPEIRETLDKKGGKSLLIDCVINEKYIKWCMVNEDLKDILIQWCIDAVEFQAGGNFVIDRDFISLPKRTCIGGEPLNIQIDLAHLQNVSKELEDLSKDIYDGKDDPLMILNAKRLDDMNDENILPPLIPTNTKKGNSLVIEIEEEGNDEKESKMKKEPIVEKKQINQQSTKVKFEVEMCKLTEYKTTLNHKYELRISSGLKSCSEYDLKFDKTDKNLLISNMDEKNKSSLKFPLPLDITGDDITSFFVRKESKLYVYIK